jgi:hypothetical protein
MRRACRTVAASTIAPASSANAPVPAATAAAVAADAQALAGEGEHARLGPDPALADLRVPVVEGQYPGGDAGRVLAVFVEGCRQEQVLPGGDVLVTVDLLRQHAGEVVDVVQPVVLEVQGMAAEPGAVGEQDALGSGGGDVD